MNVQRGPFRKEHEISTSPTKSRRLGRHAQAARPSGEPLGAGGARKDPAAGGGGCLRRKEVGFWQRPLGGGTIAEHMNEVRVLNMRLSEYSGFICSFRRKYSF
jgi:hypothetical protein